MSATIVEQIQGLRQMTVNQLREKYEEIFGESTTARNKDYLWKKIAWRIQELEYGGLSEQAKKRAREIANEHDIRVRLPRGAFQEFNIPAQPSRAKNKANLPAPGTILTREYKSRTIKVEVLENGFRYEGRVFKSLSATAREITGTNWNGRLFWGVKE
ncbi:MAG: DUF2924 domain-containing protein [Candidatus Schekmanbacteria bacterium]|nr:DUF2924 domain-containing protein [Candidatus Schekmanbacteria bacterium]